MYIMNYLEKQQFIAELQKKLSEYIIGDVALQEVISLDSGVWRRYQIRVRNQKMNFEWYYTIEEEFENWNADILDKVLAKYKEAVYKQFFFY